MRRLEARLSEADSVLSRDPMVALRYRELQRSLQELLQRVTTERIRVEEKERLDKSFLPPPDTK